ncbi:hypothetical protein COCC4DRAFT_44096 [Bipolaris maydis ATCC 48331]|uniref:Uncharacterized protein n=1 Tax=Cochliobolus heterostrophus (strain C4 / ATCC 48331 / race T) TaxID=665024 RepID=N4X262_COCH4|nr:uncharacterized protein COCC4DRAFT_44096 [Bipolaris maydis ATCC 48331]ENI00701.1 hypothetical protein COCC4DRAFT_44096 [Bipolaris maydis ATCC 48331]KAH7556383.1 hypothetical protein BM1_05817 [Bipolaris maydis]
MDEDNSGLQNDIDVSTASLNNFDCSLNMPPPTKKHIKNMHHDSFFDLARLMKEKKPYTTTPNLTPRLTPPAGPNNSALGADRAFSRSTKPFTTPETVAEFLGKQELASSASCSKDAVTSYLFEKVAQPQNPVDGKIGHSRGDESVCSHEVQSATSSSLDIVCLSDLEPLSRVVPVELPTFTESLQTSRLAPQTKTGYMTQLTKPVWHPIGDEFDDVKEHILTIPERHILALKQSDEEIRSTKGDDESQLCKLKYRNEVNKDQKASMCRLLAQKESQIKTQQLEFDGLSRRTTELEAKLKGLGKAAGECDFLRSTVAKLARERDEALQASTSTAQDYETRIQKLTETLAKCRETNIELRGKLVEESFNKTKLEDDNEDLKAKLREKTSLCDRQRNQLKTAERELGISEERLNNTKNGQLLQGAAHLVKPNMHAELPKTVIACFECYANNLECDSEARCRSCTERDVSCGRWRCSMKHKLGDCPLTPCKLSHDSQGWLILPKKRPQW